MKTIFKVLISALSIGGTEIALAQEAEPKKPLTFSGYAEVYYIQDFNRPLNNTRPGFIYSHNRSNELNVNLAFVKAEYSQTQVRANLAIAAGSYMNANYAAEPGVLKNLYEANIGVKISKKHNLWIDAGLLPSHIGFESAVGADNWTLSRGMYAENSPYFETGAKISYTSPSGQWFISALILNGWQRIQRIEGNTTPAFGHQLTYKPTAQLTFNSSSYIGNEQPDAVRKMRYFHHFYMLYQLNETLGLTAGFDIGAEQTEKNSKAYNSWYTPVLLARLKATEKFSLTGRLEYFSDKAGTLISTGTINGFKTFGYTLNADYQIMPNVLWRLELKQLQSKDQVFTNRNLEPLNHSLTAASSLSIKF